MCYNYFIEAKLGNLIKQYDYAVLYIVSRYVYEDKKRG